ncbi:unnamed protein product [Paramecium primaurelia]|uniref:Uncharacterized protein n=1 Tax=Paramecium primaurelia TaxID=5886 RepID=A0A8S1PJE5_PARPR|nr:unnamed protein product [Paramecium primaurelia]
MSKSFPKQIQKASITNENQLFWTTLLVNQNRIKLLMKIIFSLLFGTKKTLLRQILNFRTYILFIYCCS